MKKLLLLLAITVFSSSSWAGVGRAYDFYRAAQGDRHKLLASAKELISDGYYYASIPLLKEYLASVRVIKSYQLDQILESLTPVVGIKQFEMLPVELLAKSKAPTIQYILAKKLFKRGQYKKALRHLNGTIPRNHRIKPFALNLEGSIHNFLGHELDAVNAYQECIDRSNSLMSGNAIENRQLEINRDFCRVGIARVHFNFHHYTKAKSAYLDLEKKSYIWPEILFEEAWNSFYLKNYNRTLGKLVTYKAPILSYVYNPEIEILNALTYFELCMYDDVTKSVERFYREYGGSYKVVKRFLENHGKDYRYYYLLAKSKKNGKVRSARGLNKMINSIVRDPVFIEMFNSFQRAKAEYTRAENRQGRELRFLQRLYKNSLLRERNLIGAYVRSSLLDMKNALASSLQGMSAIKLEILKQRKRALYANTEIVTKKRGNIKNLKRTAKQYFWNFNGEFWADELGDYVFSLKSRCE